MAACSWRVLHTPARPTLNPKELAEALAPGKVVESQLIEMIERAPPEYLWNFT